ncbi:MAG: hydroxyacid dehydrogenase [Firmicutes bacterium]|nr:hydroxyacid dehydrogenase [Bacillota bacterium]
MSKPLVLIEPHFRSMDEVFAKEDLKRLKSFSEVISVKAGPLPEEMLERHLPNAWAFVSGWPELDKERLDKAKSLRAILEIGGHFEPGVDYEVCFERGIRVLSCAPAFGPQVAEMALALTFSASRGIVGIHEDFRQGKEKWFGEGERVGKDFSLFNQDIGLVGCGSIARILLRLLRPFGCHVRVYDPWLPATIIEDLGCEPCSLDEVMARSKVVYILAVPTQENKGMISKEKLALMPDNSLLVLVSRAHLVDFDALTNELAKGRLQAAIDVFPKEPLPLDHPIRRVPNVVLTPHQAAGIMKGRQLIGRMVVDDLELMSKGLPPMRMQVGQPEHLLKRLGRERFQGGK